MDILSWAFALPTMVWPILAGLVGAAAALWGAFYAGASRERAKRSAATAQARERQLREAADAPRDRDAMVERLRRGGF